MSKANKQQALFADAEQFLCECGCNQYGFRSKRGQKRKYINATHKKRAQRAREKAERERNSILYTPPGWLYFAPDTTEHLRARLWETMTDDEKDLMLIICNKDMTPQRALIAVRRLFGIKSDAIQHNIHVWCDDGE